MIREVLPTLICSPSPSYSRTGRPDDPHELPSAFGGPIVYESWTDAVVQLAAVTDIHSRWDHGLSIIRLNEDSVCLH